MLAFECVENLKKHQEAKTVSNWTTKKLGHTGNGLKSQLKTGETGSGDPWIGSAACYQETYVSRAICCSSGNTSIAFTKIWVSV